jgi:hypothetical protein
MVTQHRDFAKIKAFWLNSNVVKGAFEITKSADQQTNPYSDCHYSYYPTININQTN